MKIWTRAGNIAALALTALLVFFPRFASTSVLAVAASRDAAARSEVGESLAQDTSGVLEVPPGGKPSQDVGNLLRVEVDSLQVLEEGKVIIFLSFINKTKEDLSLSMYQPEQKTFAVDDLGNMYRYENSSGIGIIFTPLLWGALGDSYGPSVSALC